MDETTPKTPLSLAVGLDRDFAAMFSVSATVPDEPLRLRLDRAGADLMGAVARGPIFPVERLPPTLRPAP